MTAPLAELALAHAAALLLGGAVGWTELARVVRGRFLSLRQEDFMMAAELAGCGQIIAVDGGQTLS